MTYSDIYQIVGEAYIAGHQAGMEKSAKVPLPSNLEQLAEDYSAALGTADLGAMKAGFTGLDGVDLNKLTPIGRHAPISSFPVIPAQINTGYTVDPNTFMDFSTPDLATQVGSNLLPPVVGNFAATGEAVRSPLPPSAGSPDPSLIQQLLQPGWGTAARGLGGAGLGYLIGKGLGDHGTLGATLGGVAGLTPEIIKYAPKAFEKLKGLFGGK